MAVAHQVCVQRNIVNHDNNDDKWESNFLIPCHVALTGIQPWRIRHVTESTGLDKLKMSPSTGKNQQDVLCVCVANTCVNPPPKLPAFACVTRLIPLACRNSVDELSFLWFLGLSVKTRWRRKFPHCRWRRKSWPRMCCQGQEAPPPSSPWLISESFLESETDENCQTQN